MDQNEILDLIQKAVIAGDKSESEELARKAVRENRDLQGIIEKGFIPGIRRVGQLWEDGEYFLPELIASAESMKAAMVILEPELAAGQADGPALEKVVIGTVEGDIHDIGKNLVASMLSAHGFEVIDLGADVKLERFIETAVEKHARFICLSALLTTTMLGQKRLIEMRREKGLEGSLRILVGGAPVNAEWAKAIGADAYGENAMAAVRAVQSLC